MAPSYIPVKVKLSAKHFGYNEDQYGSAEAATQKKIENGKADGAEDRSEKNKCDHHSGFKLLRRFQSHFVFHVLDPLDAPGNFHRF